MKLSFDLLVKERRKILIIIVVFLLWYFNVFYVIYCKSPLGNLQAMFIAKNILEERYDINLDGCKYESGYTIIFDNYLIVFYDYDNVRYAADFSACSSSIPPFSIILNPSKLKITTYKGREVYIE